MTEMAAKMRSTSWQQTTAGDYLRSLTHDTAIESLRSLQYHDSHRALVKLVSTIKDDERHDGLRALACTAYGWMPTILKKCEPERFNQQYPIGAIRGAEERSSARKLIGVIDETAPVNGSWVGTSKLMHFLNPDIFPIWDSRVAVSFNLKWPHQINNKGSYLKYFDFMQSELTSGHTWLDAVAERIKLEHGYAPSRMRCLELMLFDREA